MSPTPDVRNPSGTSSAARFAFALVALTAAPVLAADPVKVGLEVVVSDDYARYSPRVASDPAGNFIVVWQDLNSEVQAGRWFATGNEFLPPFRISGDDHYLGTSGSTSTGNVGVAGDAAGNFVVAYGAFDYTYIYNDYPPCYGEPCLFTRRNDANGVNGPTFNIQDPTKTYVYEFFDRDQLSNPEIAALGNGGFVVAWEGYDKSELPDDPGSFAQSEGAFAAKTTSTGQRKGSYFRVNTFAESYQGQYGDLAAAGDADGNFVVVFRSEYADDEFPGGSIRAQRYDDKGKPIGTEFGLSSDDADGFTPDIAQAPDGTFMVIWSDGSGDVAGRIFDGEAIPLTGDFPVAAGDAEYPAVAASDDSFVVVWTDSLEVLGQRFDTAGNELSSEFQVNTTPIGFACDVAASANGDFVATWKNGDGAPRAQQFQAEPPVEQEIGVFGKSLAISNKLPDEPEKNKILWKASGLEVVAPPRGTASDPRCNGDPTGTVKATLEFSSPTSGHGSGVLELPCQNWLALGGNEVEQVATRSYRYFDSRLDDGACSSVLLVGTKSITVTCKGSGETTDLPYDLEVGTGEGTVHAVLDMGLFRFCASFPPSGAADGSDGRKFKGKNAPIAFCP